MSQPEPIVTDSEIVLDEFFDVLRMALLMICRWVEKRQERRKRAR